MEFKKYEDPNYGFTLIHPEGWDHLYYSVPNLTCFSNPERDAAIFVYILSKSEEVEERLQLLSFIGRNLFDSDTVEVRLKHEECGEEDYLVGFFIDRDDPDRFEFHATIKTFKHNLGGIRFEEKVIVGITFNEKIDKNIEPVNTLISNLGNLVEKYPSPMGFNSPFVHFSHKVEVLYEHEKWEIIAPATWEIIPIHDDFIAKAGGCVVGVKSFIVPEGQRPSDILVEVNANIIAKDIGMGEIEKRDFKCQGDKCTFLGETEGGVARLFAMIEAIDRVHRNGGKRTFHIYKFAAYPTWLEPHFLPIATASLLTWKPGPYYLYEVLGGTYIETIPKMHPATPKTSRKHKPSRIRIPTEPSETYKRFREKLREDMKDLADWQKNLWTSTYQTLKMSDTITSTYTLEDRFGKTKLVSTGGLASPTTHRFWRHKEDTTWQTTLATRKPFVPKIRTNWEELKWKWEKEQKRLEEETEERKRKIDETFK